MIRAPGYGKFEEDCGEGSNFAGFRVYLRITLRGCRKGL